MGLLFGKLKGILIGVGAVLAALAYAFMSGRARERDKHKAQQAEDYIDTRKRIDEATADNDASADELRERMRERIEKRKG